MMTSRAEYRLLLRQDNADLRLTEKGYNAGLIPESRYKLFVRKQEAIKKEIERLGKITLSPASVNGVLAEKESTLISTGSKITDLIKRPELNYWDIVPLAPSSKGVPPMQEYVQDAIEEQVNIQIKYEGYISMQLTQAAAFKKMEHKSLPETIDYNAIAGLRLEARQKLSRLRPANLGQASRITGVSPADLSILLVYLKSH